MRLPVRPPPHAGELLSGYLTRLALANALRPRQLWQLMGLTRDPDFLEEVSLLSRVAAFTGQPADVLGAMSLAPLFSRSLDDQRRRVMGNLLLTPGRVYGQPVCPLCLRETGVFRREWRISTTTLCDVHHQPLIDQCACGAPISVSRRFASTFREDVPLHYCDQCGQAYANPENVEWNAAAVTQRFVQGVLTTGSARWGDLRLAQCEAVDLLGFLAHGADKGWELRRMTVAQRREVMSVVGEVLQAGPDVYFRGLRQGRQRLRNYTRLLPETAWVRDLTLDLTPRYATVQRVRWAEVNEFSFSTLQRERLNGITQQVDSVESFLKVKASGEFLPNRGWWSETRLVMVRLADTGRLDRVLEALLDGLSEEPAPQAECTLALLTSPGVLVALKGWRSRFHDVFWEMALTRSLDFIRLSHQQTAQREVAQACPFNVSGAT